MSIKNSIEKIIRESAYKKILIIDGNVHDVFKDNGSFIPFTDYLKKRISEKGFYEDVYVWDRIEGLQCGDLTRIETPKADTEQGEEIEDLDVSFDDTKNETGQFKDPNDFFPILYQNIKTANRKIAFILNYSNYLFQNEQTLNDIDKNNLTLITKSIREQKIELSKNSFGSAIVLVTANLSNIPVSVYKNNPDAKIITLSLPDRDERKEIIETTLSYLNVLDDLNQDNKAKVDLIDALDGFTTKEILQFIISSKNQEEISSIEKLLTLYKYGQKDSPWEKLDAEKVKDIENILSRRVKGQSFAIQKVKEVVIRAKTGLSGLQHSKAKSKPKGVLFFAGPTGVGKTELAKSLAEFLFGDENACIRFDMSEYNHEHSDQKLIGAPPGYVGYEAGGQLTNIIKERPFSILLFDEIEKAHPKILDKFLQILEDGRLTDSKGETVYFSECIIVFTSNIGANSVSPNMDYETIKDTILKAIKNKFDTEINRPELLGRIGYANIISFNFITDPEISFKIAKAKLQPVINYLKENKSIILKFDNEEKLINHILANVDKSKGGRDILNKIEDILISKLSLFLFENEEYIYPGTELSIIFDNETKNISFEY